MLPILLSNLAQPFFLIALVIRDILWLRIVLILAELCLLTLGVVMYDLWLVGWNLLFVGINSVQVTRLIRDRQPTPIDAELSDIYTRLFSVMTTREFVTFWSAGHTVQVRDAVLILEGDTPQELALLLSGAASVSKSGQTIDQMERGCFFGEMEFLTGQPATATVECRGVVKYMAWSRKKLNNLEQSNPQTFIKLQGILGKDLIEKIKRHHLMRA